jgi:hypothetical protein
MVLNRRGTYSICQPFWKRFSKKTAGDQSFEPGQIRMLLIFDRLSGSLAGQTVTRVIDPMALESKEQAAIRYDSRR